MPLLELELELRVRICRLFAYLRVCGIRTNRESFILHNTMPLLELELELSRSDLSLVRLSQVTTPNVTELFTPEDQYISWNTFDICISDATTTNMLGGWNDFVPHPRPPGGAPKQGTMLLYDTKRCIALQC
jgi:hypothetical protein